MCEYRGELGEVQMVVCDGGVRWDVECKAGGGGGYVGVLYLLKVKVTVEVLEASPNHLKPTTLNYTTLNQHLSSHEQ